MTIKQLIKSKKIRSFLMTRLGFIPDSLYIKLFYFAACGEWPDLKNPKGFNEKLNWLKLHEDYSKYVDYCDKIKVREIIKEKLGDGYMFPLIGQWKSFGEIDFDSLPNEFVLKCNHDSGSTKIIRDKNRLNENDWIELERFFNRRVKTDNFISGREPCYKGIERFIIAEELMNSNDEKDGIKDYKFFCFNGTPQIMFIATDRNRDCKFDFFDMDFNHLNITNIHPQSGATIPKPKHFDEMKEIATSLSQGMRFVRIDLYELNDRVFFGEYTFFHGGGFNRFYPEEWELKLGEMMEIGVK